MSGREFWLGSLPVKPWRLCVALALAASVGNIDRGGAAWWVGVVGFVVVTGVAAWPFRVLEAK